MKIDKKLNLVTSVTREDGSIVYLHVTPFPYEVVEEHCILLGNLFTKFISQVGGLGAARIAAMMLRQSLKAEIDNGRTGPNIVDEIQRLTVVIHNVGGQWKSTPLEVAFWVGVSVSGFDVCNESRNAVPLDEVSCPSYILITVPTVGAIRFAF